ncbi:MAG: hypothetical protein Q9213_008067 [Squamulea squamosa]
MAEAEAMEKEIDTGGAKQTFKDLFAGAAGGVAQVLLGQPFGNLFPRVPLVFDLFATPTSL